MQKLNLSHPGFEPKTCPLRERAANRLSQLDVVSNRRQTSLIRVAYSSRGDLSLGHFWSSAPGGLTRFLYRCPCYCIVPLLMVMASQDGHCTEPALGLTCGPCLRAPDSCPGGGVRRGLFHLVHEAPFNSARDVVFAKDFSIILRPSLTALLVAALRKRNMWLWSSCSSPQQGSMDTGHRLRCR